MKKLDLLIIFSILIILTSCGFEVKNDEKANSFKIKRSELYGSWIQTSEIENSEKPARGIIKKINFKNDLTAEIEILDSSGYRTIIGEWTDKGKKVGPKNFEVTVDQDIVLTFWWNNDSHFEVLALSSEELNKKNILISYKLIFEKE